VLQQLACYYTMATVACLQLGVPNSIRIGQVIIRVRQEYIDLVSYPCPLGAAAAVDEAPLLGFRPLE
jgi:hypothetical protein